MVKDKEIKDRILELITADGGNKSIMARKVGVTPNYLLSILTSDIKGVSATLLKGFTAAGFDVKWLITGENEELNLLKSKVEEMTNKVVELEKKLEVSAMLIQHLEDKLYPTKEVN